MTTFYNFALKIETSWAKKVVKPILETSNAANMLPIVIVYVCFIHSLRKSFKEEEFTIKSENNLDWIQD